MRDRHVTRREFAALAIPAVGSLAGCAVSGGSCGGGERSINGIKTDEAMGETVRIGGEVLRIHRNTDTGESRFTLEDPSGVAVVDPADGWGARVDRMEEGQCLVVEGRVAEIYDDGEYTTCVDPAEGTCSWLTQDIRVGRSTWTD